MGPSPAVRTEFSSRSQGRARPADPTCESQAGGTARQRERSGVVRQPRARKKSALPAQAAALQPLTATKTSISSMAVMPDEHDEERLAEERGAKRVESRAKSLGADESESGSDDPHAQAKAILGDSDAREDRVSPPGKPVEPGSLTTTFRPTT